MKYIVIVGCGQIGKELARDLSITENVVVVDKDLKALETLTESFNGKKIWGNALDVNVLEEAGVKEATAVYLLTNNDNLNLVVGKVVKRKYGIKKVILQVNDIAKKKIFSEKGIMIINRTYLISDILKKCLN
jgi:trk system potassium uptake protein TrkA